MTVKITKVMNGNKHSNVCWKYTTHYDLQSRILSSSDF
jgi:hypothetical protein